MDGFVDFLEFEELKNYDDYNFADLVVQFPNPDDDSYVDKVVTFK